MFYIITICGAATLIALCNFFADGVLTLGALGYMMLITFAGVVAVIAVDGILAFVARRMPEKWFSPEAKLFTVAKWEHKLYRKTKINTWKKYVPELGCFTGFHKDKMQSPDDSAYLGRFLLESNYGVAGHLAGATFGFLILLIPSLRTLSVALPIAVVNMVLSLLPTMILRFNTPALRKLYRRTLEREQRKKDLSESVLS